MTIAEKLTEIASNVPKVYEAGKAKYQSDLWDAIQDFGRRTYYQYGFAGIGLTNETFKPKYNMKVLYAPYMFSSNRLSGDLAALLEGLGVTLDFSACDNLTYLFMSSGQITRIGEIANLKGVSMSYCFRSCGGLETIDKINVGSAGSATYDRTFENCTALKNVTFEGVIGQNIDLHWSTLLSAQSIASIIGCLSGTSAGKSLTLPSTARANYDAVYGTGAFDALITPKTNWTVILA